MIMKPIEPVTVLRPTEDHDLRTVVVAAALVAPATVADQPATLSDGRTISCTLYVPSEDVDVRDGDTVVVRGKRLRVLGQPALWRAADGSVAGTVIQAGRQEELK